MANVSFFPPLSLEELQLRTAEFFNERGLDEKDFKDYELEVLTGAVINDTGEYKPIGHREWAVVLKYHKFDWSTIPNRQRIRRSNPPIDPIKHKERDKYLSKKRIHGVELFLSHRDDWQEVANNIRVNLVIPEGEIKTIQTKKVLDAIGLSDRWAVAGVQGHHMLKIRDGAGGFLTPPLLNQMDLNGRDVYLAFDADPAGSDAAAAVTLSVQKAAAEIVRRGGRCYNIDLTRTEFYKTWNTAKKLGIDDFFLEGGTWADAMSATKEVEIVRPKLTELLDSYVFCNTPTGVIERDTGKFFKKNDWLDIVANKIDYVDDEPVSAGHAWLKSTYRVTVEGMTFYPNDDYIGDIIDGKFNTWIGWPVHSSTPKPGMIDVYQRVLVRMFGEEDAKRQLQFFAHGFQRPWEKPQHAFLDKGSMTGTGKTVVNLVPIMLAGDEYGVKVDGKRFFGRFNAWLRRKIFVFVDEVQAAHLNPYETTDHVKDFVTMQTCMVEMKGRDAYSEPNFSRLGMASNDQAPIKMTKTERRTNVLVPIDGKALVDDASHQADLTALVRMDKDQLQGLLNDMMKVDLEGYDPGSRAVINEHTEAIMASSESGPDIYAGMFLDEVAEQTGDKNGVFFIMVDAMEWCKARGYTGPITALGLAVQDGAERRGWTAQTSNEKRQIAARVGAGGNAKKGRWISPKGLEWSGSAGAAIFDWRKYS